MTPGRRPLLLTCSLLCWLVAACSPAGTAVGIGATAGVAASQERGFQGALTDSRIRLEINHLLLQESETLYSDIHLQVQEGRVLLSGTVPDPQARVTAVRLTWQAPGVREVINEIEVADDSSVSDYGLDTWLATQLKSTLLFDNKVQSINYSIEVVNQSIFLMGIAQDKDELQRVIDHAKNLEYVRRVVSYVKIKTPRTESI